MQWRNRLLADQRGFTMLSVTMTMMVLGVFAVGAWSAANGDIPMARADQDHKRAYEAAQAGLEWYAYQLERDPNYWTDCEHVPAVAAGIPGPVNLEWDGNGKDPRIWRTMEQADAKYTLEILHRNGTTTGCDESRPDATALQDNTLRMRATGKALGETRSIIATFKRRSFMDFIYFTSSEAQDPIVGGGTQAGCLKQRIVRSGCSEIRFSSNDVINGPLHTNDSSILACGTPTFGRPAKNDVFEVAGPAPGVVQECTGPPTFNGPKITPAGTLTPPPQNSGLATLAGPNWTFIGQTCLVFRGDVVDVYHSQNWNTSTPGRIQCQTTGNGAWMETRSLVGAAGPPNGVIYIANSKSASCSGVYTRYQRYTNNGACGDVAVSGSYGSSVTVGSENDVIITADLTQAAASGGMLGLIATNFVRVYHPIAGNISGSSCGSTNNEPSGYVAPARIEAAMLALNHSFMADNYLCGDTNLGSLTVVGAIAQLFRGTVATGSGGGTSTGYKKNYIYDDRLKVREPPNFLDPVQTSWRIVRQTEQKPAVG
jgi:type II secretory pathway pseudopilin PulG